MKAERLTKKERHALILAEIRRSASVRISRLAKRIGVAGETIRRDLIELGEAGLVKRTYGGATISLVTSEPVVLKRSLTMVDERVRIGRFAAGLAESAKVVMIDGGSTTLEVASSLAQSAKDLVMVTNCVAVASTVGANESFRVLLCPGTYDHREGSVFGEDTVEFIGRYNADIAIIGISGITTDGLNDMVPGAAAIKRAMISRSMMAVLVATHDKFGRACIERVCPFDDISDVVTDAEPNPVYRAAIEHTGGILHVCPGIGDSGLTG